MIRSHELIVDNFAGGGGTSYAIEQALGRPVDIAINHDPEAIHMHTVNHPRTRHLCEDVWSVDPVKACGGRPVGLAWFSPDCRHFSKAKGGKPVKKKIRGLAWVALKWAALVRPRVIVLENVEEFTTWGPLLENNRPCPARKGQTFRRWLARFKALGYREYHRELKAHQYGARTIRKRLFIVLRCDGIDPALFWPEPTHGPGLLPYGTAAECIDWSIPCPSIFLSREEALAIGVKRPLAEATMRRIARGVKRYVIDAAKPFIVPIAHYNGSNPLQSIDDPLRTVTANPKGGSHAVVTPMLANLTHHGEGRVEPLDEPLRTITGAHRGEKALVTPFLAGVGGRMGQWAERSPGDPYQTITAKGDTAIIAPTLIQTGYGEREGQQPRVPGLDKPLGTVVAGAAKHALVAAHLSAYYGEKREGDTRGGPLNEPLRTQPTENRHALVTAFLAQHNTERGNLVKPGRPADSPLSTITARGTQQQIVASYMSKMRGTNIGSASDEPLHTVSASGTHHAEVWAFLQKYYGTEQDPRLEEPMHTIPTKDRFAVVKVYGEEYMIVDIGMRMLTPRELFRAQGFPDSYIIDRGPNGKPLSKTAQVRMCGNSVSPPPVIALLRAQFRTGKSEAAA